jgi:hypothetical protein
MAAFGPKAASASFLAVAGSAAVAFGALFGAAMVWALLHRQPVVDREADRRALELRAQDLAARGLVPGSPLACLDALAGEGIEAACEKALFAYAAARLTLLSDMVAYLKAGGQPLDATLASLRRAVEADRFGFLAHALMVRDGCTSRDCKALDVLHDATQVRANLRDGTLGHYLEHYLIAWAQPAAVADAAPAQTAATPAEAPPHKLVNIDFPTAASIPAVSIMNPEPPGKSAAPPAAANPAAPAAAAAPERRPRKQAANPPAPAAAPAAAVLPPAETQVEPVWTPAPASSQAAAPPAANVAPAGTAPVQLNPFASSQ